MWSLDYVKFLLHLFVRKYVLTQNYTGSAQDATERANWALQY